MNKGSRDTSFSGKKVQSRGNIDKQRVGYASPAGMSWLRDHFEIPALVIAALLCVLCLAEFNKNIKGVIVGCCLLSVGMIGLSFWKGRFRERLSMPTLAVTVYFLIVAVSVCWTCAGKFFLREFSKLLYVLPLFLFAVLYIPKRKPAVKSFLLVICSMSAIFALLSVDLASAALTWPLLGKIPGIEPMPIANGSEIRLSGVFSNANISGGVHGFAILLTYALFDDEQKQKRNAWAAFLCGVQGYTFILGVNRSAIAFLCLSLLIVWACSRNGRAAMLGRILITMIPPALAALVTLRIVAASAEPSGGFQRVCPLVFWILSGLASAALEVAFDKAVSKTIKNRHKKRIWLPVSLLAVIVAYALTAVLLNGAVQLTGGTTCRRAFYPAAGDYKLQIDGDEEIRVVVRAQDHEQAASRKYTTLYRGLASKASFSVAEDSAVVFLDFSSESDCTISRAAAVGDEKTYQIHLGYPLLPEAISKRLVGIWAAHNLAQRFQFFRDGMKIWKDYPIFGAGLGAFESLIAGYQEFRYVTRYVHNHYIQVLVDNGIVGLVSYLFILVSCFLCILRGRKEDDPFHWLFAPMAGAFVMLVLHSFMDVIMSTVAYLPFAYAFFGVCALCWGKPLAQKWLAMAGQIGLGLISLTYAVLISLNMRANSSVNRFMNNPVRFFNALESAIRTDLFEYTDWKVSYLTASAQLQAPEYKNSADRYAAELLDVPSNSLHTYLVNYYLGYRNYEMALQAAQNGAHFNYADADTWNRYFADFQNAAAAYPEDLEEIYRITLALSDSFHMEIERMFKPISLSEASLAWIETATGEGGA